MKKVGIFIGKLFLCGLILSCSVEVIDEVKYTVSYESEYGAVPDFFEVVENTTLTKDQLPVLEEKGYTFCGWYIDDAKIEAGYKVFSNIALTAKWTVNTDTVYKVIHYQQNIEDDEYTLFETEEKSGTTGSDIEATAKEYVGFVAKEVEQGIIFADGSAEVKVYYDRKIVTLSFDSDGGSKVESITGKYGDSITDPEEPIKEGYSFIGWDSEIPKTMPVEDATLKAKWLSDTDTIYKVAHYQQNIEDDEYTLFETEEKSGTTGSETEAEAKEYEGFVVKDIEQGLILADGSAEIKIYYDRKKYTVTFIPNGGTLTGNVTQTVKYGEKVNVPLNPTREGHVFLGWYTSDDEGFSLSETVYDFSVSSTSNIVLYANWKWDKTNFIFVHGDTVIGKENTNNYTGVFIKGRTVMLNDFYICKYEVTQKEYFEIMNEKKAWIDGIEIVLNSNPSRCSSDSENYVLFSNEIQEERPVEAITWYDALIYCNFLSEKENFEKCYDITIKKVNKYNNVISATVKFNENANGYRLPTEAEWEYAARGGNQKSTEWNYLFSGACCNSYREFESPYNEGLDIVGWYLYNNIEGETSEIEQGYRLEGTGTHQVGLKNPNTLGLCDMSGNVWEWCWDIYGEISPSTVTNPQGAVAGSYRMYKGGSWYDDASYACVCDRSSYYLPSFTADNLGFRVVRTAK